MPGNNDYGPHLLPQHATLLQASSISVEVARARGYRSVETKVGLERKGFSRAQRTVPTLLIPIWNVAGECALYQHRPDEPRVVNGKLVKYETVAGARMALDVPPPIRHLLGRPDVPLFVTEGVRKADAAVTAGLCCSDLLGVWAWRGTNDVGGLTALADWELVHLSRRAVYICFDSDVMAKSEVHQALARLKAFLESRGAQVLLIYLPPGPYGEKVGLDDYLAQNHTVDDLLALATPELRPLLDEGEGTCGPYQATPRGLVWHRPTQNGPVTVPLTNFTARIVADVAEDDGAEIRRAFEVEAQLAGRTLRFSVPVGQFGGMGWPIEHLGAGAIVYPGFGTKDHARAAIQFLSGPVRERQVYGHLGWREIGGCWAYLHAGGAIGPDGPLVDVDVRLPSDLERFVLPAPPEGSELAEAVRASLRLLKLAPSAITVPIFASIWRAPLGPTDLTVHGAGPTGAGKTELAALAQQHYGPEMDARHLPASWLSTGNALEALAFAAKDALLVVDDFAPAGSLTDVQRYHREADRLLRAQGDRAGRQRLRPDATLRPLKVPRALVLSTGEDVPRGHSLRARLLVLELGPDDIEWDRLTVCQTDATAGLYAQAMAGREVRTDQGAPAPGCGGAAGEGLPERPAPPHARYRGSFGPWPSLLRGLCH